MKQNFGAGNVAVQVSIYQFISPRILLIVLQGIDYAAGLSTNFLPGGADPVGIQGMADMINQVTSQCGADTTLVVAGYSQGAAVVHRAVEDLPAATMANIAGVVTFGDTQNQQDNEQVPNFPKDKTMIICATGDAVCRGTLTILPAHLSYGNRADDASEFLTQMIQNAQGGAGAQGIASRALRAILN